MKAISLILALPLIGCASAPERVEVPIPVPCVTKLPPKPEVCEPKDKSRPEYLRCVLVNCERTAGYAKQLEAALTGCASN